MSNQEKAALRRSLELLLDHYRSARQTVALRAMRLQAVPEPEAQEISFYAIGIAESLDRLGAAALGKG